ncbi:MULTISPECIES: pectinesterase family protein [unclassified Enterococcus]|jgi:pectinesterase|uniref:pectinesterase family protein n=1 Tax=unclassified Enterococcus TaxID=2608891 RepID=UPI003D2E7DDF
MKTEIWIGKEETCDFSSIQKGIDYLSQFPEHIPKKMMIAEGVYEEYIESRLSNFTMVGLGNAEITGMRYARQEMETGEQRGTFRTATVFLEGTDISIENVRITNRSGPGEKVGQAVALFNMGHRTTLKNCKLSAYQDTLCTGPLPALQKDGTPFVTPAKTTPNYCQQFYCQCLIEGTIDFIFGGADARFEECELRSRKKDGPGFITAASTPENQPGYSFNNCLVSSEAGTTDVYLGRPWRSYAKIVFKNCRIGAHIHIHGWDNWGNPKNEQTVLFQEIENYTKKEQRPDWVKVKRRE